MKKLTILWTVILLVIVTACAPLQVEEASTTDAPNTSLSNKEKVVALLSSLETGDPEPVAYVNPEKYIQHNLAVADGLAGFGEFAQQLPKDSTKANVVRVFEDGDFVFAHTEYDVFGPKIGFDIFRFEDGLIVEHWDNLQELVTETASGRSMTDGPTEVTDLDKTDANKELVDGFIADVLMGGAPEKITEYISTETYYQHNPMVADGLAGLGEAIQAMADAGVPMVYTENYMVLGEGNFVLTVSEGEALGNHVAFYDLFRVEDGLIVEHWDTVEQIPPQEEWKNDNGKF